MKTMSKYKISDNLYRCECNKEYDNSQKINGHFSHCEMHMNAIGKIFTKNKRTSQLDKYKFGNIDKDVARKYKEKANDTYRINIASGKTIHKGIPHTENTKRLLSECRIKTLENDKHIQWFNINGINVQGNWEYNIAKELINRNINFSRKSIVYDNYRKYTPDFYLNDFDVYIEVKGWLSNRDKEKYKKFFKDNVDCKIYLIRNEHNKNNYSKFIKGLITLDECEDLKYVIEN